MIVCRESNSSWSHRSLWSVPFRRRQSIKKRNRKKIDRIQIFRRNIRKRQPKWRFDTVKLGKTSERIRSIGDEAIDHVQVVVHFAVDTPLARRVAESFECRGQPETGRKERAIRFCFFVLFCFFFLQSFFIGWPLHLAGQWRPMAMGPFDLWSPFASFAIFKKNPKRNGRGQRNSLPFCLFFFNKNGRKRNGDQKKNDRIHPTRKKRFDWP